MRYYAVSRFLNVTRDLAKFSQYPSGEVLAHLVYIDLLPYNQ
jgi:hypothetical protein